MCASLTAPATPTTNTKLLHRQAPPIDHAQSSLCAVLAKKPLPAQPPTQTDDANFAVQARSRMLREKISAKRARKKRFKKSRDKQAARPALGDVTLDSLSHDNVLSSVTSSVKSVANAAPALTTSAGALAPQIDCATLVSPPATVPSTSSWLVSATLCLQLDHDAKSVILLAKAVRAPGLYLVQLALPALSFE